MLACLLISDDKPRDIAVGYMRYGFHPTKGTEELFIDHHRHLFTPSP